MKHIILIGFMGSGKTTLGHRLAKKTNLKFIDTDLYIEEKEGRKERRRNLYDSLFRRESNPNKALDSHSQHYPDGRRNRGEDLHHS